VFFWGCLFVVLACCVSSGFAGTVSVTYRYDPAGRLLSADYGAAGKVTYTYDRAGNLLSATVTAAQAQSDEPDEDGPAVARAPDTAPPDTLTLASKKPEESR
jgi:YD repeat-containing protein